MKDILDDFSWHSACPIDDYIGDKHNVRRIAKGSAEMNQFISPRPDSRFLVHIATKALWKWSDDGTYIEPVCEEGVLTEKDLGK